jgi:hypothetical protein
MAGHTPFSTDPRSERYRRLRWREPSISRSEDASRLSRAIEGGSVGLSGSELRTLMSGGRVLSEVRSTLVAKEVATMSNSNRNTGKSWSAQDNKDLKRLASENTPTRVIGFKLGRTEGAVRSQASKQDVSLKPTNQSPYNRRKK